MWDKKIDAGKIKLDIETNHFSRKPPKIRIDKLKITVSD